MFSRKYYSYLIGYTIHYSDRVKSKEVSIKATGRLIKAVNNRITLPTHLVSIESEIRSHFLRIYPTLTECYITHYQEIGKTVEKDVINIMKSIDLVSKEQLLTTLSKFVDGYQSGKDLDLDGTDRQILDILEKFNTD